MYLSRNKARMNAYPFFHILNKAKAHDVNIADSKECSSADLFIAAPIEEMNETMQFRKGRLFLSIMTHLCFK